MSERSDLQRKRLIPCAVQWLEGGECCQYVSEVVPIRPGLLLTARNAIFQESWQPPLPRPAVCGICQARKSADDAPTPGKCSNPQCALTP